MPSFFIKSDSEGFGWLLPLALTALVTGSAVALLGRWMKLFDGVSEVALVALLVLLVMSLLLWRGERVAKRRDDHETLELFAGLVGQLEQEKTTLKELCTGKEFDRVCSQIVEMDEEPRISLDVQGRITFANIAAAAALGKEGPALHGCELAGLLPERARDTLRMELIALAAGAASFTLEVSSQKDFRTTWWQWRGRAVYNVHDEVTGIHVSARDLTTQKELEAQLLRAQRVQTLGVLTGGVANNLVNLLNPVAHAIELLQSNPGHDERKLIDLAGKGTLRAAALVSRLLDFSHGEADERKPVDVAGVMGELKALLAAMFAGSIEVKMEIDELLSDVHGNSTQLLQVLLNLCTNARDAMPLGGTLSIAARDVHLDDRVMPKPAHGRSGSYVEISVADTGAGISSALQERIFEPFFTTKPPGKSLGLGLSISRAIVQAHGGFMRLSSAAGEGAVFYVYLPVEEVRASFPTAQIVETEVPEGARMAERPQVLVE